MTLVRLLFCAGAVLSHLDGITPPYEGLVRVRLIGAADRIRPADDPLLAIRGLLQLAPIQPDVARGIEIALHIVNDGEDPVKLLNPVDKVHLYVEDHLGRRVDLPPVTPEWQIHGWRNVDSAQLERLRADRNGRRPFTVVAESESHRAALGVPKDRKARTPATLELGPAEELKLTIRVSQMLADGGSYWIEKKRRSQESLRRWRNANSDDRSDPTEQRNPLRKWPEAIPIPRGTYKLHVSVGLGMPGPDAPVGRLLTLPLTDWITVELGRPPDDSE